MTREARDLASAPAATRFFDHAGGRIAYTDVGDGPLVVMVPGLGDLKEEYRLLGPALAGAGFRAVAMDIRGHGETSVGWAEHTSAALGADILALIRHLDAGAAFVIGTSMGAGAAAWAAADAPESVRGLVLVGPFVRDVPLAWWKAALVQAVVRTAFVGPWGPAAWGAYYASLYPGAKPEDFDAYRAALVANLREPGRMAALQAMLRASKADVAARLPEVHAPTLVLMGDRDPDFDDPKAEAETVAALLGGHVGMVPGAGHYPHVEAPGTAIPQILDFLRQETNR